MLCYNVCVIGVIHINKLNMKLYKNDNLVLDKNDIEYFNNFDKILFEIDNDSYSIINNEKNFSFSRTTNDYLFELSIGEQNKCNLTLKNENAAFPIKVEDATFIKDNNKLFINYQLETDDELTTIEFIL